MVCPCPPFRGFARLCPHWPHPSIVGPRRICPLPKIGGIANRLGTRSRLLYPQVVRSVLVPVGIVEWRGRSNRRRSWSYRWCGRRSRGWRVRSRRRRCRARTWGWAWGWGTVVKEGGNLAMVNPVAIIDPPSIPPHGSDMGQISPTGVCIVPVRVITPTHLIAIQCLPSMLDPKI